MQAGSAQATRIRLILFTSRSSRSRRDSVVTRLVSSFLSAWPTRAWYGTPVRREASLRARRLFVSIMMVSFTAFSRANAARSCTEAASSTVSSSSLGSRIIQPPKLPPVGRSKDATLAASFRKPCGEDPPRRESPDPEEPLLPNRMLRVYKLKALWIEERFDRFRKRDPVLAQVLQLF